MTCIEPDRRRKWPKWLQQAQTTNAMIELCSDGVVWHGGDWRGGVWHGGEWRGGEWHGGEWHDGVWRDGVWRGGVWHDGVWRGGVWRGREQRLPYMLALLGCVPDAAGVMVAYRTTRVDGGGRFNSSFTQLEGEHRETNLPPAGAGTCVQGIHVTTAARAWTYFGVDPTCQFWRVRFTMADVLDCDGEKIRIAGGHFEKMARPF